jgi:hypothetical protein
VAGGSTSRLDSMLGSADVAVLLSFGLLLDGTSLESVSRWDRHLLRVHAAMPAHCLGSQWAGCGLQDCLQVLVSHAAMCRCAVLACVLACAVLCVGP